MTEAVANQPVRPLLEGDQALADAVQQIPQGRHEVRHDGGITWIGKTENGAGHDLVTVSTATAGGVEGASALIGDTDKAISAGTHVSPADEPGVRETSYAIGNEAGEGVTSTATDRAGAQAVKLEVAQRIDEARERIGQTGVEAASRNYQATTYVRPRKDSKSA